MSDFDVPPFEMDDNSLSDTDIEAVLAGDQATGPGGLHDLMGGLRERFVTSTDVPVGAALAEFIEVVDLTTTSAHTGPQRKHKMITGIGTFIATTTGKIVLGTTLAAASVGGAHAVDLVDVPGLPETSTEVVVVDETEDDSETTDVEQADATIEESLPTEELDEADDSDEFADTADDEDGVDQEAEDELEEDEDEKNHGQMVSDFAKSTELEGCEKGQAIAALASGKHKDDSLDDEDTSDDDSSEDDSSDGDVDDVDDDSSDSKCTDHDDESYDDDDSDHDDESYDDDDDDDDDDESYDDESYDDDDDDDDDDEHRGNGKAKGKDKKSSHDQDDD